MDWMQKAIEKRYQVSYEIITYDRLLDYAKHCDEAKAEWE